MYRDIAVLLPETSSSDTGTVAERLRDIISQETITMGNTQIKTTISVGISEASHSASCEEFIGQSDLAMYEAKNTGRNRVCYFEMGM